jgi:hypothetical protein
MFLLTASMCLLKLLSAIRILGNEHFEPSLSLLEPILTVLKII